MVDYFAKLEVLVEQALGQNILCSLNYMSVSILTLPSQAQPRNEIWIRFRSHRHVHAQFLLHHLVKSCQVNLSINIDILFRINVLAELEMRLRPRRTKIHQMPPFIVIPPYVHDVYSQTIQSLELLPY